MGLTLLAPIEIGVCVHDLESMARFYEQALGFARMSEAALAADRAELAGFGPTAFRMLRLQTNYGERIKLLQPDPLPAANGADTILGRGGFAYLTFIVADIDGAMQRLAAAGARMVTERAVQTRPGTRLGFFRDPEGNVLELCQYDDLAGYRPDLKQEGDKS